MDAAPRGERLPNGLSMAPSTLIANAASNDEVRIHGLERVLDQFNPEAKQQTGESWYASLRIDYRGQEGSVRIEMLPDGLLHSTKVGIRATQTTHSHSSLNDALVFSILRVMNEIRAGRT
jgi:hypothetical protein